MRSEKLALLRGAVMHVSTMLDELGGIGVQESQVMDLIKAARWRPNERNGCRRTLDTLMGAGMEVAGLPRMAITGEHMAVAIAYLVHPSNWMVAAYDAGQTIDGAELVSPYGDTAERQYVSPERMFALVLLAADNTEVLSRRETHLASIVRSNEAAQG